jgi:hypothetical protein
MIRIWLFLIGVSLMWCQKPALDMVIEGRVVDVETRYAVANATVTVTFLGVAQDKVFSLNFDSKSAKQYVVKTDVEGKYSVSLPLARYSVSATADGMEAAADIGLSNPAILIDLVETKADKKSDPLGKDAQQAHSYRIDLGLVGKATLTGSVVSKEDEKPLSGISVLLYDRSPAAGMYFASIVAQTVTDSNGRFRVGVRPGRYVVAVRESSKSESHMSIVETIDEPLEATTSYRLDYSDEELGTAPYVDLMPSQTLTLASLRIPTFESRGNLITVDQSNCSPGQQFRLLLGRERIGPGNAIMPQFEEISLKCGQSVSVNHLLVGRYVAYVVGEDGSFGQIDLSGESSGKFAVAISRPQRLAVRLNNAREKNLKTKEISIHLTSARVGFPVPDPEAGQFDEEGKAFLSVSPGEWTVWLEGLPAMMAIDEVKYNQAHSPKGRFTFNKLASVHNLEISISDRPRQLSGVVEDGDKPVPEATVVLLKMPVDLRNAHYSKQAARTDEAGRFSFAGPELERGEYRIFAVPASSAKKLDAPGALESLLSGGRAIEIKDGSLDIGKVRPTLP